MGKTVTKSFNGGGGGGGGGGETCSIGLNKRGKIDPRGLSAPTLGYIHVYDHHFQSSSTLKPHGQSKLKDYMH